jgi:hypothetical protein
VLKDKVVRVQPHGLEMSAQAFKPEGRDIHPSRFLSFEPLAKRGTQACLELEN